MRKLSKEEIGNLGVYEFQAYIGAMVSPTFGSWKGTDRLIEQLNLNDTELKHKKILEVGCSTGYITRYVAQKVNCSIIGVDLSEFNVNLAKEMTNSITNRNEYINKTKNEEQNEIDEKHSEITFQQANVENLPFDDNSFDFLYGEAITALVPDPLRTLKEYMRVLKPGGKIATLDLFMKESVSDEFAQETSDIMSRVIGAPIKIRTLKEWEDIFNSSGFKEIKLNCYYDDIFKSSLSPDKLFIVLCKMIYHMTVNKKVRQKLMPVVRFSKKFQKLIKEDNFGYFIFTGKK